MLRVPCLANPHHDEVAIHLKDRNFVWIDLGGPQDEEFAWLAELIGLHPLTLEDAYTFHQRPNPRNTTATCSWCVRRRLERRR